MPRRKKLMPDQSLNLLRQIEAAVSGGKTTAEACGELEITERLYYRWRREFGSLQIDQGRRMKELEKENGKLKRQILALEKLTLKGATLNTESLNTESLNTESLNTESLNPE